MTDQELLELAARAIKLPECGWMGPSFTYVKDNTFTDWNPLADDGDALRLAVKLGLLVYIMQDAGFTSIRLPVEHIGGKYDVVEMHGAGPYAATRRAIVCAAAKIGETE